MANMFVSILSKIFRAPMKNDFDKLFVTKEENTFNNVTNYFLGLISYILLLCLSTIYIYYLISEFNLFQRVSKNFIESIISYSSLSLLIFFLIILVIFVVRRFGKRKEIKKAVVRKRIIFFLLVNISLIFIIDTLILVFIAIHHIIPLIKSLSNDNTTNTFSVYFELLITFLIFASILGLMGYIISKYYLNIIDYLYPRKSKYFMTIPDQELTKQCALFHLYSLDSDRLVLGHRDEYDKCDILYVYDRITNTYLQFNKVEMPKD